MMFEIKNLVVNYGGAKILKGISLNVAEGEIVTLIGSNGAGKTTTMRAVSGLVRPAGGEIWFQGERIDTKPPEAIVKIGVGQSPEGRGLFPNMSVYENLLLGAYLQNDKKKIARNISQVYEIFPRLKERKTQLAATMSGGEQQMLSIAAAMMSSPKLLLLDEPSTGLAPLVVKHVADAILEINKRGTSILLVEQNARMALSLAHRGYALETGHVVVSGDTEGLRKSEHIRKAYLGL
jgi:branched-chain amino acid transport system ATP-binding protein